ncbi:MAG: FtsX-like permease family protein [Bacteroidales bacterium]|nr:FtsX-like permease family protein [Bacteroidales bacterium]
MKTEFYIAKRLFWGGSQKKSTGLMVSISVFGIALSLSVMIIAVAVTSGFKNEISDKAIGFAADIQITNLDSQYSLYNMSPITAEQPFLNELRQLPELRHIQQYCIKPGILKSAGEIQGIVLKGIGKDFEWDFFREHLVEGDVFQITDSVASDRIVLSRHIANLLQLKLNDPVVIYFVQEPVRMRRFTVSGIYETGLMEFDKLFAIVDMSHIQRLNNWEKNQISGYELFVHHFDRLEATTNDVFDIAGFQLSEDGSSLHIQHIRELYAQLFDWLSLQDTTVFIVLLLMALVAGFNMISGLLIVILERTSTIGILKALGAGDRFIRKIFLHESLFFIGKGLLLGNVLALTLCWLQWQFGIISLDQESYFLDKVPIYIGLADIIVINVGTTLAILLMLLVPSSIISRISPDTSIKYR